MEFGKVATGSDSDLSYATLTVRSDRRTSRSSEGWNVPIALKKSALLPV
jgi:hypothetical protein